MLRAMKFEYYVNLFFRITLRVLIPLIVLLTIGIGYLYESYSSLVLRFIINGVYFASIFIIVVANAFIILTRRIISNKELRDLKLAIDIYDDAKNVVERPHGAETLYSFEGQVNAKILTRFLKKSRYHDLKVSKFKYRHWKHNVYYKEATDVIDIYCEVSVLEGMFPKLTHIRCYAFDSSVDLEDREKVYMYSSPIFLM